MTLRHVGIVLVVGSMACSSSIEGPFGVTLSGRTNTSAIHLGEPVTFTATVTNHATHSVSLTVNGCRVDFYVADSRGNVVVPAGGQYFCAEFIGEWTLAPGQTLDFPHTWTGTTTSITNPEVIDSLPPGAYVLYATLTAAEGTLTTARFPVRLE
ncbi:MAG TPA: BsuPI-related putative proteinase inhibitor [Gemmatimonadales bacterium]|nr:BsuPI-related putative proteinase inhibitor [Gemmatimonadales bacterium]